MRNAFTFNMFSNTFPNVLCLLAKASLTCITSTWGQGLRSANQPQSFLFHLPATLFPPNVQMAEKAQCMYFQTIILFICCQLSKPLEHTCFIFLKSFAQPQHVKN